MENEKVEYLINMINDIIEIRNLYNKSECPYLIYNTKENYEKLDSMLKSIDE